MLLLLEAFKLLVVKASPSTSVTASATSNLLSYIALQESWIGLSPSIIQWMTVQVMYQRRTAVMVRFVTSR